MGLGHLSFEDKIFQFIKTHKLIHPRGLVILGVSGGADSMALLQSFTSLRHRLGVQLHVAHFNHRFRLDSDKDERFVAAWCHKLNIPLTIQRRAGKKITHLSEDDARKMRFDFFVKLSHRLKAQALALAHNQNDLAETVLMRIIRGSGLYGLRAILPKRDMQGICVVRPFLGVNRQEIEDYLKIHKISFCTDATNKMMMYERNRIRHLLLPHLKKEYNPQIISILTDLSRTAGEDYEYIAMQASREFDKIALKGNRKIKIKLKGAKRCHPAILRLILRQMVEELTHDAVALSFEHIQALQGLAAQKLDGKLDLSNHLIAIKNKAYLEIAYA